MKSVFVLHGFEPPPPLNNAQKTAKLVEKDIPKSHPMTRWNCCFKCSAPQTGSDRSE